MIEKRTPLFFLLAIAVFISGCSGSDEANTKVASVNVTASPGEVVANGTHTVTVMAAVKDDQGEPVSGATVNFTSTRGTFSSSTSATSATTDSNGLASATLSSTSIGKAEVLAIAGAFSSSSSITFIQDANDQVTYLSLSASPNEINAQSAGTVLLTAEVKDGENPLTNVDVKFETDFGSLTSSSKSTNENGIVSVGLNSNTAGIATINISAGGFNQSVTVKFIEDVSGQVANITLGFNKDEVVADGISKILITATTLDTGGNIVVGAPIQFKTSLGDLTQDMQLSSSNGTASVEISSSEVGQADIIVSVDQIEKIQSVTFFAEDNQIQTIPPSTMSLSTSKISVTSNNAEQAKITATLLDVNNAVYPSAFVRFKADGGQLSQSSVTSDENGEASIFFSSGSSDPSNRIATVTAISGSLEKQIPIQVIGSSVIVKSNSSSLIIDLDNPDNFNEKNENLSLIASNSNGDPVYDTDILVVVSSPKANSATLSLEEGKIDNPEDMKNINNNKVEINGVKTDIDKDDFIIEINEGKTDINGRFEVTLTAASAGTVTVTAIALNTSYSKKFTINEITQAFQITAPTDEREDSDVNSKLVINVKAPSPTTEVTFITSLGTLLGEIDSGNKITQAVVNGVTSVELTSTVGGTATVEVFDNNDNSIMDRLIVDFSAPAIEAKYITIQADRNVIPLKVGELNYEAKITAQVFNTYDFPVRNATVWFTIENATGGGEFLSPVYGTTLSDGSFETTFNSGTISSTPEGVIIKARVINNGIEFTDAIPIVIGGTAGSVVVGRSTTLSSINENTAYSMPMSVLVADSNGNPVAGTTVSLSAWPNGYYKGYWEPVYNATGDIVRCIRRPTSLMINNEDINKNLIMDLGEDINNNGIMDLGEDINNNEIMDLREDVNNDGTLTPENSAAGTLPDILITDKNGLATFNLVYLKHYSAWVESQIRISTMVQGTETTSVLNFILTPLEDDVKACSLPDSPFGNELADETLDVKPGTTLLKEGDSTTVIASGGTAPYRFFVEKPGVAIINETTGVLTTIAPGNVTVIAVDSNDVIGYSKVITVYGSTAVDESLDVTPGTTLLKEGDSTTVNASGGTAPYRFFVENTGVATINETTGELITIAPGNVIVIAVDSNDVIGYGKVITVYDSTANGTLDVAPDTTLLKEGDSITVNASGGTAPYRFFVENTGVATIDSTTGILTTIAPGSVTVIAVDSNDVIGYSKVITVYDSAANRILVLTSSTIYLQTGGDTTTVGASGGTAPYRFFVEKSGVATIDSITGVLTAIAPGSVTVIAVDSNDVIGYSKEITVYE